MSRAKRALILGGGVTITIATMALQRAGIDPVIYEAHAGGADDAGAFLTFASNGLDALRAIDAQNLVMDKGFPTPRMEIQSGTGKHLGAVPNGGTLPDGMVSQTLKRADLYRALRDETRRRRSSAVRGRNGSRRRPSDRGRRHTLPYPPHHRPCGSRSPLYPRAQYRRVR